MTVYRLLASWLFVEEHVVIIVIIVVIIVIIIVIIVIIVMEPCLYKQRPFMTMVVVTAIVTNTNNHE